MHAGVGVAALGGAGGLGSPKRPPASSPLAAASPLTFSAKHIMSPASTSGVPPELGELLAGRSRAGSAGGTPGGSRSASRLGKRPGTGASTLTAATNMSDASRLAMSTGVSLEALTKAAEHVTLKQFKARQDAEKKYNKRFDILGEFWFSIFRHCSWRKPFVNAVESASAFANVTERPSDGSASRITPEELITAFWSAVIVPEHMHLPVKFVDDSLRRVFEHFDVGATGTIDYRELFACLNSYTVNLQAPPHRLVRCWYNAFDGDARGGLLPDEIVRIACMMCVGDEERRSLSKLVGDAMPRLVAKSVTASSGKRTLADAMSEFADAKRLAKRMGEGYLKEAIPSGEEPPALPDFKLMWSPFDKDMMREEKLTPHVNVDVLCSWLSSDAGRDARNIIHSQRVLRTHEVLRARYLREEEEKRRLEETLRREIELGKKADAHRRVVVELKVLLRWHGWWARNKHIRALREEYQKRRSIAIWRKWTREDQQKRGHEIMARRFAAHRFSKRYWDRLVLYTTIELARTASGTARAERFYENGALARTFAAWQEFTQSARAYKHWRRWVLRRNLRGWGGYSNQMQQAKAEEGTERAKEAENRIDLGEVATRLEKEADEAAAVEIATQHDRDLTALAEAAARDELEQYWAKARGKALVRREQKRLAAMQSEAGRAWRAHKAAKERRDWEKDWKDKIDQAMAEEKEKQLSYIVGVRAMSELETEMSRIMTAKELSHVQQEYSIFTAEVDLKDGCIHFRRGPLPAGWCGVPTAPAKPEADYNLDSMRLTEAREVAIDFFASKKAIELRERMLDAKAKDDVKRSRDSAAAKWQHAWRMRQLRFRTLYEHLRLRLELRVDPYSGELYYLDTLTGGGFDFPMALFGAHFLLQPLPDWCLRLLPDAATGAYNFYYQRVLPPPSLSIALYYRYYPAAPPTTRAAQREGLAGKKPAAMGRDAFKLASSELVSAASPFGYKMCAACSVDFATRQCFGHECHGYLYCANCFATYHPKEHEEYGQHWDVEVSSVMPVKPGGVPYYEEQLLMDGRRPMKRVEVTGDSPDAGRKGKGDSGKDADSDSDDESGTGSRSRSRTGGSGGGGSGKTSSASRAASLGKSLLSMFGGKRSSGGDGGGGEDGGAGGAGDRSKSPMRTATNFFSGLFGRKTDAGDGGDGGDDDDEDDDDDDDDDAARRRRKAKAAPNAPKTKGRGAGDDDDGGARGKPAAGGAVAGAGAAAGGAGAAGRSSSGKPSGAAGAGGSGSGGSAAAGRSGSRARGGAGGP